MRDKFKEYLAKQGKTQNTISSYVAGINHLSKDHGIDIFTISNSDEVQKVRSMYDLRGSKRTVGDYGRGTARCAMIQYENLINDKGSSEHLSAKCLVDDVESVNINRTFTYERDLHNTLEAQVPELFPGYELIGSEYSVGGVRLDLLLEKGDQLLVVELKAGVAKYEVFGQISMYMGLIKAENPNHEVYGMVVASEIHQGLMAACSTNPRIRCKTYSMQLHLEDV